MTDDRVARLETAHTQMQREMDRLRAERNEALDFIGRQEDEMFALRAANAQMAAALREISRAGGDMPADVLLKACVDVATAALAQPPAPAAPAPGLRDDSPLAKWMDIPEARDAITRPNPVRLRDAVIEECAKVAERIDVYETLRRDLPAYVADRIRALKEPT